MRILTVQLVTVGNMGYNMRIGCRRYATKLKIIILCENLIKWCHLIWPLADSHV
ncbi:hypothetical protein MSIBF_A2140005 [groundwater metagenome]|uniref:Uncharacterized protein n=1 Tax=groundwater metagenome TaxID=717931 RepID=A0A098E8H4_9ZZZZ